MKPIAFILLFAACGQTAQGQDNPLTLDRALALAKANRSSIVAAQQRVLSARLSRRALGAFPATRFFIGYSSEPATGATDDDLALALPLDFFGRTSASRAVGDAAVARAEAMLQQALAQVQGDVIENYSEAAAAKALSESASQSRDIAQRLFDAVRVLVEEGRLPGVQLARVGIEVERARLTADQRSAEHQASLHRLAGLLDVPAQQVMIPGFAEVRAEIIDPALLPRHRADLQLLAAEIRAAEAEAGVARLGSLPELELQGRRTAWQEPERRYGLRLQLSLPISDFGKSRAETAAARALAASARRALADATRISQSELEAARIELASATDQLGRYRAIVDDARALVEKSRTGFTERAITLVELLEATRALREIEDSFVEARLRLARAQAGYLRASGRILEVGK